MKVNPVNIQAYQQPVRRETPADANRNTQAQAASKNVVIEPKKDSIGSSLAIKPPEGSYADHLTPAESQALELLFGKFRASAERFGNGYSAGDETARPDGHVGRMVDLKV